MSRTRIDRATPPAEADHASQLEFLRAQRLDVPAWRWLDNLERRHLPWPEFRRRVPPGVDAAKTWAHARSLRRARAISLPLATPAGDVFQFVQTDALSRTAHRFDREAAGRLGAADPGGLAEPIRYLHDTLREEAASTSILEGAATTRREAKELLRSGRAAVTPAERMVVNSYRALELARGHRSDDLTLDFLLALHREVSAGTLENPRDEGRLRSSTDDVVVAEPVSGEVLHQPPPAADLPRRLQLLCAFANGRLDADAFVHPIVRAMFLHFWLAYEHPFVDGNGRTARALVYWSLLRDGYWLAEYISISRCFLESRAQYRDAFLDTECDGLDATHFLQYHARQLNSGLDRLGEYLQRKRDEQRRSLREIERFPGLNARQLAILRRAVREPSTPFTRRSHANSHRITEVTAGADLRGLAAEGLLFESKLGRQFVYYAVADLPARLGHD